MDYFTNLARQHNETCDGIAQCEQAFSCTRLMTGLISVNRPLAVRDL